MAHHTHPTTLHSLLTRTPRTWPAAYPSSSTLQDGLLGFQVSAAPWTRTKWTTPPGPGCISQTMTLLGLCTLVFPAQPLPITPSQPLDPPSLPPPGLALEKHNGSHGEVYVPAGPPQTTSRAHPGLTEGGDRGTLPHTDPGEGTSLSPTPEGLQSSPVHLWYVPQSLPIPFQPAHGCLHL